MTMLRNRLRIAGFVGKRGPSYNPMVDVPPLDPTHQRLQGRIEGGGELQGTLRIDQQLAGLVDGGGELYGHLWPPLLLKGKVEGGGELSGDLTVIRRLAGTVEGGGELYGNLTKASPPSEYVGGTDGAGTGVLSFMSHASGLIGDVELLMVVAAGVTSVPTSGGWTSLRGFNTATPAAIRVMKRIKSSNGAQSVAVADSGTYQIALCVTIRTADVIHPGLSDSWDTTDAAAGNSLSGEAQVNPYDFAAGQSAMVFVVGIGNAGSVPTLDAIPNTVRTHMRSYLAAELSAMSFKIDSSVAQEIAGDDIIFRWANNLTSRMFLGVITAP